MIRHWNDPTEDVDCMFISMALHSAGLNLQKAYSGMIVVEYP